MKNSRRGDTHVAILCPWQPWTRGGKCHDWKVKYFKNRPLRLICLIFMSWLDYHFISVKPTVNATRTYSFRVSWNSPKLPQGSGQKDTETTNWSSVKGCVYISHICHHGAPTKTSHLQPQWPQSLNNVTTESVTELLKTSEKNKSLKSRHLVAVKLHVCLFSAQMPVNTGPGYG